MPHKAQGVMTYRDTSMHIKNNEDGIVDDNYIGTNNDGYKFCKVRLRCNRRPQIGDKAACLTCDHRILTETGLKTVYQLTQDDKVAVLKMGNSFMRSQWLNIIIQSTRAKCIAFLIKPLT